ncbi:MAG: LCP family protein [Chloroflexota bacterium]
MRGTRTRSRQLSPRRGGFPDWVIWALGAGFILSAVVAGALAYTSVRSAFAAWDGSGLPPLFNAPAREGTASAPSATQGATNVQISLPEWNGTDRVTILVMGKDFRDWEGGEGAPRTDTMMLISVDPVSRMAGIISIPRDLWVEMPGFEHNRINTAYSLGESFDYPAGEGNPGRGPGLAMRTVENLLGIPIQFYAVIEFSAFERMIDEIGGIDVLVPERMKISPIGRLSMWLDAKPYHLDGAEALAYARARGTEGGDFDRAQRQQQVILAIRDRVLGFHNIPTLIARAPALYNELASGIQTNMGLDQMIALGALAIQIPPENIRRGVIGPPDMVLLQTLPDGQEVLRPVPDQIRLLRDEIFTMTSAVGPSISVDDPAAAAAQEGARVAVRNGAGIEGLAGRTAEFLTSQGINVVEVGNADRMDYVKTVIIDYTGNPYTTRYLMTLLNLTQSQILSQTVPDSPVDVAVIAAGDLWLP